MDKKIIALMSSLLILSAGVLSGCSSNAKDNNKKVDLTPNDAGDFMWREITADEVDNAHRNMIGSIVISKYVGSRNDVVVPASINDKPVVAIDWYAFCPLSKADLDYKDIEDVYGITDFDSFSELHRGENLSDEELEEQYREYFIDRLNNHDPVSNITSIRLPKSIVTVGDGAYAYCDSLEVVEIYNYGENDKWITIENDEQFYGNTKLKSYNFYLSEANGSIYNFPYCTNLEILNVTPNNSTYYDEYSSANYDIDLSDMFDSGSRYSSKIKEIHVAEGTEKLSGFSYSIYNGTTEAPNPHNSADNTVDEVSFSYNPFADNSVSRIYIPSSVTKIDEMTFSAYCKSDFENVRYGKFAGFQMTEQADITIITPKGSYAEMFAEAHGIDCVNSDDKLKDKKRDDSAKEKKLLEIKDSPEEIALYKSIDETRRVMNKFSRIARNYAQDNSDLFCLISSDYTKSINADDLLSGSFNSTVTNKFAQEDADTGRYTVVGGKYDYFAILRNGELVYAAIADRDYLDYAVSSSYNESVGHTPSGDEYKFGDYSLDDLYKLAQEYFESENAEAERQEQLNHWRTAYTDIINDIDANGGKSVAKVNTDSGVSIRKDKSTDAERIGAVPYHCDVEILEEGVDWMKVTYKGTTGWVKSEYLSHAVSPYARDYEYTLVKFDVDEVPLLFINDPNNMNVGMVYRYSGGKAELVLETLPEQKAYNNSLYGASITCFVVYGTVNRDDPKISSASYEKYYTYNNGNWELEDELTSISYTDGTMSFHVENTDMNDSVATEYIFGKYEVRADGIWYQDKESVLNYIATAEY